MKNLESFLKFVNNDIPRNPNVSLRAHNFAKALPTPCQSKYKSIHNAGGNTILELCKQKQIISKSREIHSPIKIDTECKQKAFFWEDILSRALDEEFRSKPNRRKEDWWKTFKTHNKDERYEKRVRLVREYACRIFETEIFEDVLAFLCLYTGKTVAAKLIESKFIQKELNSDAIVVNNSQMLMLHFIMGGSWTQLYRMTSGLTRILNKKIKFPSTKSFVAYKRSLPIPKIYRFVNPLNQKAIGRYCSAKEVLEFTFADERKVKECNFLKPFRITLAEPTIIYAIHGDGTHQSHNLELLNFGMRCLNFGRLARNPAVLQIFFLEEYKEHMQLFDLFFLQAMLEGIKEAMEKGVKVVCLDAICQLCAAEVNRFRSVGPDGLEKWFHLVKVLFFHVYDIKARTLSLPIKNGVCFTCLEVLRSGSYKDSLIESVDSNQHNDIDHPLDNVSVDESGSLTKSLIQKGNKRQSTGGRLPPSKKSKGKPKPVKHTTDLNQLFKAKDALFRKYLTEFVNASSLSCGDDYHSVNIDDFKKSPQCAKYANEAGPEFFGYLCDPETPLRHRLSDSLHLVLISCGFAFKLHILAAQRVEALHAGFGIHSLQQALRFGGCPHQATIIERECKLKLGDRMKSLVGCCSDGAAIVETMTFDRATKLEFVKFLNKKTKGASANRVEKVFLDLVGAKIKSQAASKLVIIQCSSKSKQLEKINEWLAEMADEEVLQLILPEEHRLIDRTLFIRVVNKVEVASCSNLDVASIIQETSVKFPGGDARHYLFGGGWEEGLQQMNLIAINAKIANREMLDDKINQISNLEKKTEGSRQAIKTVIKKLSDLRDPSKDLVNLYAKKLKPDDDEADDFDKFSVENVCSDVMASLDALEQHDIDIHEYREQILQQSRDAVLLYTGNSEIEVDPVAAQLQNVFDKLKALLLPIVFPLFDTVPEMLAALDGHNERAKEFMEAAKELPDFGEHSEYLHFLTAVDHAEKECRFLLDTIGAHLSEMNCETNEHLNKILKGILVRLQGFANRPVGNYGSAEENAILNHFGFVLQEHMLKFYHSFDSVLPRKKATTCGICSLPDHNARSCKQKCPICNKKYFLGHNRNNCQLSIC